MNIVDKLLNVFEENAKLSQDEWTIEKQYISGMKKWVAGIVPEELLTRSVKNAVESLVTLSEDGLFFEKFSHKDTWFCSFNFLYSIILSFLI